MGITPASIFLISASVWGTTVSPDQLVSAHKGQNGINLYYTYSYVSIKYPNGDFSPLIGCCTDVLIRAYRRFGVDLQHLVHEDITKNFAWYTKHLTKGKPDKNIDHRRVATLQEFFSHNAISLPKTQNPADFSKGDIVIWRLPNGRLHIGLVSDLKIQNRPMVIHNIGYGVRSDDVLFFWSVIGHFRYLLPTPNPLLNPDATSAI